MFVSFDDASSLAGSSVDAIVVGSGPAGLPIVDTLLDAGARVVLLESGDLRDARAAQHLNAADIVGLPLASVTNGRQRVFGGTGQDWSGQCLPMDRSDFAVRDWVAESGWPITLDELEPYYARAEDYFGVRGCSYGAAAYAAAGVDIASFDPSTFVHRNTVYSPRHRVGSESRPRLRRNPRVHVVNGATVRSVRLSSDEKRAIGVTAVGPGRRELSLNAPVIVLACGAIENARLLLLSGSSEIGNASGHVGRHFQEHPFSSTASIDDPTEELMSMYRATFTGGLRHRGKTALSPEFQASKQLLAGTIDLDFHYSAQSSVAAVKRLDNAWSRRRLSASTGRDALLVMRDPRPVGRLLNRRVRGLGVEGEVPERVLLRINTEQAPSGPSRVTLSKKLDALGIPLPQVDWQLGNEEWRTAKALTAAAARQFAELGMGRVTGFDWLQHIDGYRAKVSDTYHQAGTTRMAEDPAKGVVDVDCQVHGVDGLYIAGGSVFPTSGHANPTLTAVALSIRLADHLTASTRPSDIGATSL